MSGITLPQSLALFLKRDLQMPFSTLLIMLGFSEVRALGRCSFFTILKEVAPDQNRLPNRELFFKSRALGGRLEAAHSATSSSLGCRNSFPDPRKGDSLDFSWKLPRTPLLFQTKPRGRPYFPRPARASSLQPAPQHSRTLTVSSGCPTNTRHMPPKPPASRFLSGLMGFAWSAMVRPSVAVPVGSQEHRSTAPAAGAAPPTFHPLSGGRGMSPGQVGRRA